MTAPSFAEEHTVEPPEYHAGERWACCWHVRCLCGWFHFTTLGGGAAQHEADAHLLQAQAMHAARDFEETAQAVLDTMRGESR